MSNFFFKYKKIFVVLIIIVTVISIPLTVFISQKQQDIRQRASGEQIALYFAKGSNCSNRLINSFTLDGANTNIALSLCLKSINGYAQGISGFNIILSAGNNLNFSSPTVGADADKIDITPLPQILDAGKTLRFTRINIDNNVMDSPLHLLSFTVTGTGTITTQTAEISSLMKADLLTVDKLISSLDINTATSAPAGGTANAPITTPVPTAAAVPPTPTPILTQAGKTPIPSDDCADKSSERQYHLVGEQGQSICLGQSRDFVGCDASAKNAGYTKGECRLNNTTKRNDLCYYCGKSSNNQTVVLAPTPTSTQIPVGKTFANFKIALSGIVNNPKHANRKLTIEIFDPSQGNAKIGASTTTDIANDQSAKRFKGASVLDAILKSGVYNIKVKTDGYLRKLISAQITKGVPNELPLATLIPGDISGDNKIDLEDYNLFVSCYGNKVNLPTCKREIKELADFNDDIVIDGIDYNTFIKGLSVKEGD